MDAGKTYTQKKINKLTKNIEDVYAEAYQDISKKLKDFTDKYVAKDAIYQEKVKNGEMSEEDYKRWEKGQVFQGKQWKAKKDQIAETIMKSNQIAAKIISGESHNVFAFNANYTSYGLEHGAGINFGLGIYDEATVIKLIKDDPKLLPEWKIDEKKDYVWNQKKLNNAVTQGIIQGENLDKISDRISKNLSMQNKNSSMTFARTAMTGAQNAGRSQSLINAKAKGIKLIQQWMATFDARTRDTHAAMDGETIKVGDKWHPQKFSNGCRFPGDPEGPPHEVYNCRCTLVGDLEDYPEEFERYDNIDGKPVKDMTYKEWYKAKYGKDFQPSKTPQQSAASAKKPPFDFSKYGGEEAIKVMQKYNYDWKNLITNAPSEEIVDLKEMMGLENVGDIKGMMDKANADKNLIEKAQKAKEKKAKAKTKKLSEEEQQKKDYEDAKKKLEGIEQEIKDKGADKKFEGIWYGKSVSYADWEQKKDSIPAKKEYYEEHISKYKKEFYDDIAPDEEAGEELWNALSKHSGHKLQAFEDSKVKEIMESLDMDEDDFDNMWMMYVNAEAKVKGMNDKLELLEEFEKHGEEYSKLLAEKTEAQKFANSLKPKPKADEVFKIEAYTQERKDAAVWAKSPREADNALRSRTGEVWRDATKNEKEAIYEYTSSYSKFNEPLRGWEYGQSNYATGAGFKGVGNTDLNAGYAKNGARLNAMTDVIDKCTYDEDVWLQRGCQWGGMDKFFGVDMDLLQNGTQEELENALLGTTPTEFGFMSCGSSKGRGFSGNILLNIYAPSGTKMMYVEPFSAFGNGDELRWDGISEQTSFGNELETILQQGTQFRVVKVEKVHHQLYFDLEVINQNVQQRWKS